MRTDYKQPVAGGAWDHRGDDCATHGDNVPFAKPHKSSEPYLCVACMLEAARKVQARREARFECCDCGFNTDEGNEYYFVHRALWKQHGASKHMLCIGCLERRAGRELRRGDFTSGFLEWVEKGVTFRGRHSKLRISDRLRARIA